MSIEHSWNGTVLTVKSDSGSTSADLKGEKGDTGPRGPQGPPGEKGPAGEGISVDLSSYLNSVATYYPTGSGGMVADNLTVPVALIPTSTEQNAELADLLNTTFAYVVSIFYGEPSIETNRCQIAFKYNAGESRMALRHFHNGVWSDWGLIATTDILSNEKFTLTEDGLELTPFTGAAWFAKKVTDSLTLNRQLIDVVGFGADPTAETDSSTAIQEALDWAAGVGAAVYFPSGGYRLDKCVYYGSNTTLLFASGATLLRGKATTQYLLANDISKNVTGYNGTENVRIIGATFDGNSDFSTTASNDNKCTLLNTGHAKNISVENCTFKNGNVWHFYEVCASENVKIINCTFDGSNYSGTTSQQDAYSELLQFDNDYVSGSTSSYGATENGTSGDLTPCKNILVKGCKFICNGYANAIGNHNPQSKKHALIRITECFFMGGGGTGGYIDFDSSTIEVDIYNNTFDGNAVRIAASNSKSTVHDNRIENASTPYTGSLTAYCNLIGGALDSSSEGDAIETIDFSTFGTMRTGSSTYGYATLQSADIKKYKGRLIGELKFKDVTTNGTYAICPVETNEAYRPKVTAPCWAEYNKAGETTVGIGYISAASSTIRVSFPKALSNVSTVTVWFDYAL